MKEYVCWFAFRCVFYDVDHGGAIDNEVDDGGYDDDDFDDRTGHQLIIIIHRKMKKIHPIFDFLTKKNFWHKIWVILHYPKKVWTKLDQK